MKNKKLHINFKYLSAIFILIILASCGSFDSSSLVSSDGIYSGNESSKETLKPKSDYFKNYFSEESSKYDLNLLESDSLNFDSYLISSDDIVYSNNNPSWGDIPTSVDYVLDYRGYNYRSRFYSAYFSYYDPFYRYHYPYAVNPYFFRYSYGGWYPYMTFGYFSPYYYYAFNSPYYSPYWRWGRRGWYDNLYGYDIHDNYRNNTNVSYNRGRRGSSSNVVVYSNGRSSTANDSEIDNDRVRNYNKTREIINNIGDSGSSSNSSARTYLDPGTSNMNGSRNLRNYINSGVLSNQGGKNSTTPSPSKRYYNDPYSNSSSSWGLSGRSGNSNQSRNASSRSSSSSNWVNPSSSSRSSSSSSMGGRSYNYSSSSSGGVSTSSGRSSSSSSRSGGIRN
ncbi:hypothetical protein OA490_00725 [Flavobacteriales bacterium]|nr:hypothetical protein [Flavobacteriales bacterium]